MLGIELIAMFNNTLISITKINLSSTSKETCELSKAKLPSDYKVRLTKSRNLFRKTSILSWEIN